MSAIILSDGLLGGTVGRCIWESVYQVFFGQAGVAGFADYDMVEKTDADGFAGGFNRAGESNILF